MEKSGTGMQAAKAIVSDTVELVSLPDVYWRVKHVLDDPDSSTQELARVISTDPAISARLLRLANSAFWGLGGQVGTVSRAVSVLGSTNIHDMVLAASVGQAFKGLKPQRMDVACFWRGSVYRALAAAALARRTGLPDPESLFVTGLLSDLGHMVLYQKLPELAARALEMCGGLYEDLSRIERGLFGCDYAQVGAALIDLWRLPAGIRAPIEFQADPDAAGEYALEAALLHFAGRLAADQTAADASREPRSGWVTISASLWNLIGLDEPGLSEVVAETAVDLPAMTELFVSGLQGAPSRTPLHA